MKQCTAVIIILLIAFGTVSAQEQKTVVEGEYNVTHSEKMMRHYMQKHMVYYDDYHYSRSDMYISKGFGYGSLMGGNLGMVTMYTRRLHRDLHLTIEFGNYLLSRLIDSDNSIMPVHSNGFNQYRNNAMVYPLYVGLRRGISIPGASRVYPYVGVGAGLALGIGYENDYRETRYFPFGRGQYNATVAPTFNVHTGVELYTFKRGYIDLNFRYRHLEFYRNIAQWKDVSGFAIDLGFGFGIGGMQLLR